MISKIYTYEAKCDRCDFRIQFQSPMRFPRPVGWYSVNSYDVCPKCLRKSKQKGTTENV